MIELVSSRNRLSRHNTNVPLVIDYHNCSSMILKSAHLLDVVDVYSITQWHDTVLNM
jgi:hypothetical protein